MDNRTAPGLPPLGAAPASLAFQCLSAQVCQRHYPHRIPWRRFPFTLVLAVERGAYVVDFRDERCTLGSGQVAVVATGAEHAIHIPSPGTTSLAWAHVDYTAANGVDLFAVMDIPRVIRGAPAAGVADSLRELAAAGPAPAGSMAVLARQHELGFHLLRLLIERGGVRDHPLTGPERFRIEPALQFIERNLHRPFPRSELARQANLSVSRFHDVFRGIVGVAPMEYVQARRMNLAKRLLINTDRSVAQIAFLTGFGDPCYFSRLFRRTQGCSPARYRRDVAQAAL